MAIRGPSGLDTAIILLPPANEVWGKVIFSVACVKNSVHRGVCLSACYDTPPGADPSGADTPQSRHPLLEQTPPGADPLGAGIPWEQTPPEADTLLGADPPRADPTPVQCMLGDTVNKPAVCILLECNLIGYYFRTNSYIQEVGMYWGWVYPGGTHSLDIGVHPCLHLVAATTRMVGKRAVRILLECFLVY